MLLPILAVRGKQFARAIGGIGLLRLLFLMVLAICLLYFLMVYTSTYSSAVIISCMTLLFVATIQLKRPDKHFLKSSFGHYRIILFVEYTLLCLPIEIGLLWHGHFLVCGLFVTSLLAVVQLDWHLKNKNYDIGLQRLIPATCFEWKTGVRQSWPVLLPIWAIGLVASFYIGSVPIALLLFALVTISFYEANEPYQMVIAFEKNGFNFLRFKIVTNIKLYSLAISPLVMMFLFLHIHLWYIVAVEYFLIITLLAYNILVKYAYYVPNDKNQAKQVFNIIGLMTFFIPLLLPMVWLLSLRFYIQSAKKLKPYLNDFD